MILMWYVILNELLKQRLPFFWALHFYLCFSQIQEKNGDLCFNIGIECKYILSPVGVDKYLLLYPYAHTCSSLHTGRRFKHTCVCVCPAAVNNFDPNSFVLLRLRVSVIEQKLVRLGSTNPIRLIQVYMKKKNAKQKQKDRITETKDIFVFLFFSLIVWRDQALYRKYCCKYPKLKWSLRVAVVIGGWLHPSDVHTPSCTSRSWAKSFFCLLHKHESFSLYRAVGINRYRKLASFLLQQFAVKWI